MEILFDRVKTIESEIYRFMEEDRTLYSSIRSCDKSTMLDMALDAIRDLMLKANFACADFEMESSVRSDGYPFRVFNGKYWEHAGSYDIRDAVGKYLRSQGLVALFSSYNSASSIILNTITSTLRKKVLHPRLTLMCFKNGVVDFARIDKRPMLKSHKPKYDVVKMYDFKYEPTAFKDSEGWKNFLGEPIHMKRNEYGVLPEDTKRRQLQMFLGALLIPRDKIKFEYFMIMQGTGGNGKSVIFQLLEMIFGKEEVCSLDVSQFCRPGDEKLRAMASLIGKRMLYCPEELVKSLKNIQGLKSIVSGETQQYRKLGGDIESLYSLPIVMFNTNKRWRTEDFVPQDDPHDDSMSRRAQIINFDHTIPVSVRDTELAKKLEKEKAGIFSWIVKGYMDLKENGYRMPENVAGKLELMMAKAKSTTRTPDGRYINGSVGLWLDRAYLEPEKAENTIEMLVSCYTLYNNYKRFCDANGLPHVTQAKFGRDLTTLNFLSRKTGSFTPGTEEGMGGRTHYRVYCGVQKVIDAKPSRRIRAFYEYNPNIVDDARSGLFEGTEMVTDEEYCSQMYGTATPKDDDDD